MVFKTLDIRQCRTVIPQDTGNKDVNLIDGPVYCPEGFQAAATPVRKQGRAWGWGDHLDPACLRLAQF